MRKQKAKRKSVPGDSTNAPTKERFQRNGGLIKENPKNTNSGRYRVFCECPLDAYRGAHLISAEEHEAGIRFRHAYYDVVLSRPKDSRPVSAEEAAQEPSPQEKTLNEAYAILPPDERGTVIDVCGFSQHLWNPAAFEKMRKGLGHLAVQWNMAAFDLCGH